MQNSQYPFYFWSKTLYEFKKNLRLTSAGKIWQADDSRDLA